MKRYYTMFLSLVLTALAGVAPVAADNGGGRGGLDRLDTKLNARIDTLEANGNVRIDTLEVNTNARFDTLEANTNARINTLEGKLEARFDVLEGKVDTGFESIEKRFDFLVGMGKWLIGILVTILISVLAGMAWLFDRVIKREAPPQPKAYSSPYAGGADFDALVEAIVRELSNRGWKSATGVGEETGPSQCPQNSPPA